MKSIFTYKPASEHKTKIEIPFPPGIFGLLIFTLIFLKISHQISWSWWFILSPVIIGTLISLYCFIKRK
jgi:hypothetical protein